MARKKGVIRKSREESVVEGMESVGQMREGGK